MIWLSLGNSLLLLKRAFSAVSIALLVFTATGATKALLLIDDTGFILALRELPLSEHHLISVTDHDLV